MIDYPPGNTAAEVVRATRYLGSGDADTVLAYYPWARMNPYQALIYSRMWRHQIAPVPVLDLQQLDDVPNTPAKVVFHLHWTTEIIGSAKDDFEARERVRTLLARLDRFQERGGRFVWTVHNVMPHVCPYPEVEIELRTGLSERADLIHSLCQDTIEAAADFYPLDPDKTAVVPHPSYGTYFDAVASRAQARFEMDINPDHTVVGVFGAMKAYKGLDRLQSAFDIATRRPQGRSLRLLAAGMLDARDPVDEFVDWALADPLVFADFRKVPLPDLQLYLAATDVVALPYRRTLNSGVALMALSQGIPLIGPDVGCVAELITDQVGIRFDAADDDSFAEALERAGELRSEKHRAAARARANDFAPSVVSDALADAIRSTVED